MTRRRRSRSRRRAWRLRTRRSRTADCRRPGMATMVSGASSSRSPSQSSSTLLQTSSHGFRARVGDVTLETGAVPGYRPGCRCRDRHRCRHRHSPVSKSGKVSSVAPSQSPSRPSHTPSWPRSTPQPSSSANWPVVHAAPGDRAATWAAAALGLGARAFTLGQAEVGRLL